MGNSILAIQINKPCHENWDDMDNAPTGRYCAGCQKNVVDFSKLSNQEIINYISGVHNLCGRFDKTQFDQFNLYLSAKHQQPINKNWRFAALLIGLLPLVNAEASAKPGLEQHQPPFKKKADLNDSTKYYALSGVVRDTTGFLPGAYIRVKGTDLHTETNANGYFELSVPSTADTLVCSFIGFNTMELPVNEAKTENYNFTLSINESFALKSTNFFMGCDRNYPFTAL